ncbi:relaxase/mobilization nuclease domain-containing protein, partial [Escherichia coli O6]|nr:relaxase/mobilization nuclease domain-containing protein [Escherichia coli O6]HAH8835851.1 relaxase/mobilization nuclease domain-containing protein [Escherichia coli]
KNQYSILWVEHQDKGRLELNFVIPNMELQSGKRLQPYYDRADRPRIDAWQTGRELMPGRRWLITITGCMTPTPRRTAGY